MSATAAVRRGALVWGLLLCSSVLYFFSDNRADNDLWGHLLFGHDILQAGAVPRWDTYSYTAAGAPWLDHEWLAQVLLAAVYGWAGSAGLLLLKLALGAGTFLCLFVLIRRRTAVAAVWGGSGLVLLAILARGFAIRPQIFTYLALAVELLVLDAYASPTAGRGWRYAFAGLPLLFVLWANVHGGFVLGLGVLALFACADLVRAPRQSVGTWVICLVAVAVSFLNPYGSRLFGFVWDELGRAHPITEWQAARVTDVAQWAFFATLAALVATLFSGGQRRAHWWQVGLALATGALAVRQQRHTPVFAVCAAVPLAAQLDGTWARLRHVQWLVLGRTARQGIAGAVAVLALIQFVFTAQRYRRDGLQIRFDAAEYPTSAVQILRAAQVSANLAVPLDWGEYALWFLAPRVKVSLDGRFATVFPASVVQQNFDFFSGASGWQRLLTEHATEAVLMPLGSACPVRMLADWQLVVRTPEAQVYARVGTGAWRALQLPHGALPIPSAGTFP